MKGPVVLALGAFAAATLAASAVHSPAQIVLSNDPYDNGTAWTYTGPATGALIFRSQLLPTLCISYLRLNATTTALVPAWCADAKRKAARFQFVSNSSDRTLRLAANTSLCVTSTWVPDGPMLLLPCDGNTSTQVWVIDNNATTGIGDVYGHRVRMVAPSSAEGAADGAAALQQAA